MWFIGTTVPCWWYYGAMIRETIGYDCTCERCGYVWFSPMIPARCSGCKSRKWNEAEGEKPAPKIIIEKKPETPRAIPLIERVRQIEARDIESEDPICEYTEYVSDIGETYRCKLPLGHRSNHRMGSQIS